MAVSGNIGDSIRFEITDATSVTGVRFGSGQANFNKVSQSVIDALVPQTATYDKVVFQKENSVEVFDITATGDGNDDAYNNLSGIINTSGFFDTALSGCATGAVTFSDVNSASGVCVITATGSSLAQASGLVVSGHESGYCGGPTGFTTGDYVVSETRLGDVTASALGGSDNFVAFATVEYTGDLNVKQAAVTVTCNESGIQTETTDKFVPVSRINNFTIVPSGGGTITIFGNAFTSVTGVRLGSGINLSFTNTNTGISATVPTGEYDDFIHLDLRSGLSAISDSKYVTSGQISGSDKSQDFFVFPSQKIVANLGSTDNVIINGSGLNNLNSIIYRSKTNVEVTPSSFTSTSGQAIVSISGLATGIHDVIVTKSGVSFTGSNFVEIQDSVSHGYAFENHVSSGFRYVQEKPTSEELATALSGESFEFSTTEESDRVQVTFSGGVITGGNVTFNLSKKSIVSKNVTNEYTVKGFGLSASDSETEAFNKFNSGIYSEDQYGDYSSEFSYSLDSRVCSITGESTNTTNQESTFTSTGTYTGQVAGDPLSLPLIAALRSANQTSYESYTGTQNLGCSVISSTGVTSGVIGSASTGEAVNISATSFDPAQNLASINSQISNTGVYSGYVLLSTSTGISDNFESVSYSSGISFPFATSQLEDTTSQIWHNVFNSGIDLLYPSGWTGQHSLTSGFAVITGSATGSSTLTFSGKSIDAVNSLISGEIQNNRKYCTTGDPAYFNTGEIVNLTETGYFYGYC